jgi:hypothetical protein
MDANCVRYSFARHQKKAAVTVDDALRSGIMQYTYWRRGINVAKIKPLVTPVAVEAQKWRLGINKEQDRKNKTKGSKNSKHDE